MQTLSFILHLPLNTCLPPPYLHDVSVQTFYLLFALRIFGQINRKSVCVSDKDRKAQRNVLTDSSQQKQNDHNEQHTLLSYCMTAIFESCYDFELFPSTEMLINPVGCGSAEVLLSHLDVLCLGQSRWTDRCISKR